jgi:hypothetical protein
VEVADVVDVGGETGGAAPGAETAAIGGRRRSGAVTLVLVVLYGFAMWAGAELYRLAYYRD